MPEKPCNGCGDFSECNYVRTTNGGLWLCRQCLDDVNRKNPALAVMTKRKWRPLLLPSGGWIVEDFQGHQHSPGTDTWPDPFTALIEADKWYRGNVEQPS